MYCFNSSVRTNNRTIHNTTFRATRPASLIAASTGKLARNYTGIRTSKPIAITNLSLQLA